MNGTVFNIQKFCVNDGPGIRTTVFLKGCPLRCAWCHNPESHKKSVELFYDKEKCVMCGECAAVCDRNAHLFNENGHLLDREKCRLCLACTDACPSAALEAAGEEMSVEEVMKEVLKDRVYYKNSGGGMTVSGGEPLMQYDFTCSLLKAAKDEGLHTCLETCGYAEQERLLSLVPYVDLFLFDWKITEEALHRQYTGVSNRPIAENLAAIDKAGGNLVLRCPIIPGVNDRSEHFRGIADTANSLCHVLGIDIEPYHPLGLGKAERLGGKLQQEFGMPERETVETWLAEIRTNTNIPVKRA